MSLDSARVEEAAAWFAKARNDLRAAGVDMQAEPALSEDALFHCQQAAEKAIKGFLTWHDQPFRKTHNLVELGMQATEVDSGLEPLLREAAGLSEYSTRFRYPGEAIAATREEATKAMALARDVVDQLLAVLPMEVSARMTGGLGL